MNAFDDMNDYNERDERFDSTVSRILRERAGSVRTAVPLDVERSLRMALGAEMAKQATPQRTQGLLAWLRRPLIAVPAAVATIAVVVFIVRVSQGAQTPRQIAVSTRGAEVKLQDMSYTNFASIVRGDLKVVKESSKPSELNTFFKSSGVSYEVFYPEVEAELVGGVVSEHDGHHFAHLVYSVNDHLVYLFEVDQPSIDDGTVSMASLIEEDLKTGRWHWEERPGVGTLFVWKSNNVVCSAVSDLATNEFSALFNLEKL